MVNANDAIRRTSTEKRNIDSVSFQGLGASKKFHDILCTFFAYEYFLQDQWRTVLSHFSYVSNELKEKKFQNKSILHRA